MALCFYVVKLGKGYTPMTKPQAYILLLGPPFVLLAFVLMALLVVKPALGLLLIATIAFTLWAGAAVSRTK